MSFDCSQKKFPEKKEEEKKGQASVMTREHKVLSMKKNVTKGFGLWILDGGATDHMTNRKDLFVDMKPLTGKVEVGDGHPIDIEGIGTVKLNISSECGGFILEFKNVLYIPELKDNLISQGMLDDLGMKFSTCQGVTEISDSGKVFLKALKVGTLYYITTDGGTSISEIKQLQEDSSERKVSRMGSPLWHNRLGHLSEENLKKIKVIQVQGKQDEDCESCCEGKMKRLQFPSGEGEKATKLLERIHSDVVGPISPNTLGQVRWFVTFIDEFSRFATVFLMKNNSEVFEKFKLFKNRVECLHERKIKELQSDNGKEYISGEFRKFLEDSGTLHRVSVMYTPQQNGLAERYNQTVLNVMRC